VGGDKLAHVVAYLVLALWFGGLYSGAARGAHALGLAVMGVGLEFLQEAGGVRQLEVADMLANGVGVFLGWFLSRFPALGVVGRLDRTLDSF
jgi:VanZ family protein